MNKQAVRIATLISAALLTLLAGCSGRVSTATSPPPPTTTFPSGTDPRTEEVISVGPVRVFESDFLFFQGTTRLPDGTLLESQLYESGELVQWWPSDQPITANNGMWEIRVPLGVGGAPIRLAVGPQYLFKVWEAADPSVQRLFTFDLVGPPPVHYAWWQALANFFDDLLHGRLWRNTAPRTSNSPIHRDMALLLAAKDVPPDAIKAASKSVSWSDGVWRVTFFLPNSSVTRDQLGWPEGPDTTFENHGRLPSGSFSILTFDINATSGAVLSRQASDGIIVGPMDGMTEMPDNRVPPWTNIASGAGGLLVGGTIVWLVFRARAKASKRPVG